MTHEELVQTVESIDERLSRVEASQQTRRQQIIALLGELNNHAEAMAKSTAMLEQLFRDDQDDEDPGNGIME